MPSRESVNPDDRAAARDSGSSLDDSGSFLIIGTAGHIDHGKTALIRALTGTDCDRLPEEKRRGVTIELGFAQMDAGGYRFGVVDVPGHERFVRTMVAGATGIDIALLVVAADDSVMPQTREHIEILDLLGVSRCVVAITKCDLVDEELAALVVEEVIETLEGTALAGATPIRVSSVTGTGLDDLRGALLAAAAEVSQRSRSGPFRLAVDRVFTVQGRGTVVTGSVLQGRVASGDALELWPGGHTCRVRGLESHGDSSEMVQAGQRAAVNLIGVDRDQISRGCELATPGYVQPTHLLDVRLRCLASSGRPVKSRGRVRVGLGTRELLARVVTPSGGPLAAGESGYAQLRFAEPVIAAHGQRFILRDESATRTIGGGLLLRCSPKRRRIRGPGAVAALETLESDSDESRVEEVLRFAGFGQLSDLTVSAEAGVALDAVPAILGRLEQGGRRVAVESGGQPIILAALDSVADRAVRWLKRFHEHNADEPGIKPDAFIGYLDRKSRRGLGRALLDRMLAAGQIKQQGRYIAHTDYAPSLSAQDERVLATILEEFHNGGFQPPALNDLRVARQTNNQRIQRLVKIAVSTMQLVEVGGKLYLHHAYEERLRDIVKGIIQQGEDASVSAIRQELGSTRKFVVPFLEYLDRVGFTRRDGDRRVLCEADDS